MWSEMIGGDFEYCFRAVRDRPLLGIRDLRALGLEENQNSNFKIPFSRCLTGTRVVDLSQN